MGTYTNFGVVVGQIVRAYKKGGYQWPVESFANVFSVFYAKHREKTGQDHPRLRTETIARVMHALEDADENGDKYGEADTLMLIDQYFADEIPCDYSIAHFVSGQIRAIRNAELM